MWLNLYCLSNNTNIYSNIYMSTNNKTQRTHLLIPNRQYMSFWCKLLFNIKNKNIFLSMWSKMKLKYTHIWNYFILLCQKILSIFDIIINFSLILITWLITTQTFLILVLQSELTIHLIMTARHRVWLYKVSVCLLLIF